MQVAWRPFKDSLWARIVPEKYGASKKSQLSNFPGSNRLQYLEGTFESARGVQTYYSLNQVLTSILNSGLIVGALPSRWHRFFHVFLRGAQTKWEALLNLLN